MDFILGFSLIGCFTSLFLGFQFLSKGAQATPNLYLGTFFLLIALRVGKLPIQEFTSEGVRNLYFNVMHASYLGLGPVVWHYIRTYLFPKGMRSKQLLHFLPSITLLLIAFQIRSAFGDSVWIPIYWIIQIHPLVYVIASILFIRKQTPADTSAQLQKIWLYSLAGCVLLIAVSNVLYFLLQFPFYMVTSTLLLITAYLIISLAFQGNLNIIVGKHTKKYQNLNLSPETMKEIWLGVEEILRGEKLFLNENLKLAEVSTKVNKPSHIVSMVINSCSGRNFKDYVNSLRIDNAQQQIVSNRSEKILSIALESGFTSLSAFNKAFKKNTGVNPSEFRAQIQKEVPDL